MKTFIQTEVNLAKTALVTGFKKDTGSNPQLGSGVWKSTETARKSGEIRCVCTMGRRSQGAVMGLPHFTVLTQAYGRGESRSPSNALQHLSCTRMHGCAPRFT
ncbi:hypothetical protein CIB84_008386 [Bambusicola thoracicus]|uniref:Uncharacterized protein n=1 Tax=Bambusicola thoracicus TaxID=9083 RepID=A0A2P4SUT0_BAMTH|nr:hypothetical protein CIB84_008386 [Bambusicola thoracicus]